MIYYILGILANIFVILRAFPQIIKILYYKSAIDVSHLTNIFIIFYSCFWLAYGIVQHEFIVLAMAGNYTYRDIFNYNKIKNILWQEKW